MNYLSNNKALKVRDGSPLDVPLIQFGWRKEESEIRKLKKELIAYLRERKPRRQSRKLETAKRGRIPDIISIIQHRAEVEDRIIHANWEGVSIIGKDHKSAIGTLEKRSTRYCLLLHLWGKMRKA